jgi:transposase
MDLLAEEVAHLKRLHKAQKDRRKADRIKIILLLHKGYSQKEVADILLLDEDTITRWKTAFLNRPSPSDWSSWLEDKYVGYVGKLSYNALSRLRNYLAVFTVASKARIQEYLALSEQTEYSLSGLQKLLVRIGMCHTQLARLPGLVDVGKQAAFLAQFHHRLAQLSSSQTILYLDSAHPQWNSVSSKCWMEKGSQRWLPSNTGRQRVNIAGAYHPFNQEVLIQQAPRITAQVIIELLKQVIARYAQYSTIYLIADNARYHKCQELEAFLATQSQIKMWYLPPYSPNLNLIERLWKLMHEKTIHGKFFDSLAKFKAAIHDFFQNIHRYTDDLKSRITFNFQTFDKVNIALS